MNYFSRNVADEMTARVLAELFYQEQLAAADRLSEIDDYWQNNMADEDKVSKYFPSLPGESSTDYGARLKIAIPFFRIFVEKIVSYFYKGATKYQWVSKDGKDSGELEDQANAITQGIFELNKYEIKKQDYLTNVLKYGKTLAKPRFIKYLNGQEIKYGTAPGAGAVYWQEFTPYSFIEIQDSVLFDETRGVRLCYDYDGNVYPILSADPVNDGRRRIVELITATQYDYETGKMTNKGIWRAWENDKEKKSAKGEIIIDNEFDIFPCVLYRNKDDESMLDKSKSMIKNYNDVFTALLNITHFLGYPMLYQVGGSEPKNLVLGPNRFLFADDPNGTGKVTLGTMNPTIDMSPYSAFFEKLERFISFIFSTPLEVMNGLIEAKSGVQLKMLFSSLLQLLENLSLRMRIYESEYMYKSLYIYEKVNKMDGRFTKTLRPAVIYDHNIIPTDDKENMEMDYLAEQRGWRDKIYNVMKYNPEIKTQKEAEAFVKEQEKKAQERFIKTAGATPEAKDKIKQQIEGNKNNQQEQEE